MKIASYLIVSLVAGIGAYAGVQMSQRTPSLLQLQASTLAHTDDVSLSTGAIDENTSGLYILDHETGELQCWAIDQQSGKIHGTFRANVGDEMEFEKSGDAQYLMSISNLISGGGVNGPATRAGESVCFVAETKSGKIIGYKVVFDQKALVRGRHQKGSLKVVSRNLFRGN